MAEQEGFEVVMVNIPVDLYADIQADVKDNEGDADMPQTVEQAVVEAVRGQHADVRNVHIVLSERMVEMINGHRFDKGETFQGFVNRAIKERADRIHNE